MKKMNLEEIKSVEISILKRLQKICENNEINFSLAGGSAIGIIRHQGIIPWDDDIDIMMLRDDFDKLKKIFLANDNNIDGLMIMSCDIQKDYNYYFAKVIDISTDAKETGIDKIENYGIFLDIFQIDRVPINVKERKHFYRKMKIRYKIQQIKLYSKQISNSRVKLFIKKIISLILIGIDAHSFALKTDRLLQKYNKCDNDLYGVIMDNCIYNNDYVEKKQYYNDLIKMPFEDFETYILRDYDKYLKNIYGNYMEFPPEESRNSGHNWDYVIKK